MTDKSADSANPSARFDHVERLLNVYPAIDENQLAELKRWFAKEASAFEVASLASRHPSGYAQFRADHIDGFKPRDMAVIAAVVCVLAILAVVLF
ncbi:hypothetical protein GRI62_02225 [Erythrobacter arachoides]|uniref:Uncharacterized protein n=1 Tax=Aurantiacibacter arachoides TaxID=1850444 RepID=A0A844ZVU4_9SPHN|nr:hypothetical protein [Aurantiacibacter arachoides]MXO92421.1 hypothetical protein [Aurantiacibacter arachoides]GGD57295.1 hypothetical protein GCM10011411_16680 [Aurantiacibacter arachoides]